MRVGLVTHPSSLEHRGPAAHPERPDRIGAAVAGVEQSSLTTVALTADAVERDALLRVHDRAFVDALELFCAEGGGAIDLDTYAVEDSWLAAIHAAGAGATAVNALRSGAADVGFVAMRPPGHHAERGRAMGFCLFNNVAIGASTLTSEGQRVAIVDWDVHHGNGTQNLFAEDPEALYVSLHQHPFYPGTGSAAEIGDGPGEGTTINIPMPEGAGGADYREAMARIVLPVVEQFAPDWLLVSAGYDAHANDPLAGIRLTDGDYAAMSSGLAPLISPGRTVFFLEGGYDLAAVRDSVAGTLDGHAGVWRPQETGSRNESMVSGTIDQIVETLAPYWDVG